MNKILGVILLVVLISSCGVITKTRYGNGIKIDFGNSLFVINEKAQEIKAEKAVKLRKTNKSEHIEVSNIEVKKELDVKSVTNNIGKNNYKNNKITKTYHKRRTHILNNLVKTSPKLSKNEYPMERNAVLAGILYYGGMLIGLLIPFVGTILSLIGFILAIVALGKIKQSGGLLRGKGLAISVIVLFILGIIAALIIVSSLIYFLFP